LLSPSTKRTSEERKSEVELLTFLAEKPYQGEQKVRTGKTKRGVDLRGTFGMPKRGKPAVWAVVMDRSRALFFEKTSSDSEAKLIKKISNPEGRVHAMDLVSDRPGRSFDSNSRRQNGQASERHSLSSSVSPQEEAAHKLAHKVADCLEEGRGQNRYEHLILVAEPRLLGVLRRSLNSHLSSKILTVIEKHWCRLSGKEVTQKLATVLSRETPR
jgi:protein required for attachment to host cells